MRFFGKMCLGIGAGVGLAGCGGWGSSSSHTEHEYLYVASNNTVGQFRLDAGGALTPLSPASAPAESAYSVTATKNGRFVYAANRNNASVSQYAVGSDGKLTPLSPATVSAGTFPTSVATSPDNKHAYAIDASGTISQYSIGSNGRLTPLSPATVSVATDGDDITVSPDGKFVYATSYGSSTLSVYGIGSGGLLTPVTSYSLPSCDSPKVSPNGGFLYVATSTSGTAQYSIAADGTLTPLSPALVPVAAGGNDAIAVTSNGDFLYNGMFNGGVAGSPVGQWSVAANGTISALSPATVPAGNAPRRLALDPQDQFLFVANANQNVVTEFAVGADGKLTAAGTATVGSAAQDVTVVRR